MIIQIKKFTRIAIIIFFSLAILVTGYISRIVIGKNDLNLSKLDSKVKNLIGSNSLISPAKADMTACQSCCADGCGGDGGGG